MNTIDNMQNEKDFYDHYNVFEYNHDLRKCFKKIFFNKKYDILI